MERDGGMKSQPGPWTIVYSSTQSRSFQQFGQLVELILAGRVGRDALLCEPGGQPRALGDVPELAVLFADEHLRSFLQDRRSPAQPWWSRGIVIAGVAVVLAVAGGVNLGRRRTASNERTMTATRSPAIPRADTPFPQLKGIAPERARSPMADHAPISPVGSSLEPASGVPAAGSMVTAGM